MAGRFYKGWDSMNASLSNVQLPEKICCSRCRKWKGHANFARKRLNELRLKIRSDKPPFTAQCITCTPQQVVELRCYMCCKIKGLDEFAKAQRKNPDRAKCNICMKEQLEMDAVEDKRLYHGEVLDDSDSDDSSDSDPEINSLDDAGSACVDTTSGTVTDGFVGDFDALSFEDSASTTTGSIWTAPRDRPTTGGDRVGGSAVGSSGCSRPLSYAASVASTSTAKSGDSTVWGGTFNPMKYGNPGAFSVADSMETNRPASSKNSGWAKIKAFKAESEPDTESESNAEEGEDVWGDADEEESSSDDEESDDE